MIKKARKDASMTFIKKEEKGEKASTSTKQRLKP